MMFSFGLNKYTADLYFSNWSFFIIRRNKKNLSLIVFSFFCVCKHIIILTATTIYLFSNTTTTTTYYYNNYYIIIYPTHYYHFVYHLSFILICKPVSRTVKIKHNDNLVTQQYGRCLYDVLYDI